MSSILQVSFIESLFTVQNVYTLLLVLIAFVTWQTRVNSKIATLDNQINSLKTDIEKVQGLYNKITNLDTNSQLMKQDLEYLKKDYDLQIRATEKMKDDIHHIKGALVTIEHYFKLKSNENL